MCISTVCFDWSKVKIKRSNQAKRSAGFLLYIFVKSVMFDKKINSCRNFQNTPFIYPKSYQKDQNSRQTLIPASQRKFLFLFENLPCFNLTGQRLSISMSLLVLSVFIYSLFRLFIIQLGNKYVSLFSSNITYHFQNISVISDDLTILSKKVIFYHDNFHSIPLFVCPTVNINENKRLYFIIRVFIE